MKLLILIIAVILMSVLSEPIYAQNEVIEPELINIEGEIDHQLKNIEIEFHRRKTRERNGKKKILLLQKLSTVTESYIPKKIEIEKQLKIDRERSQAFDKYINCISTKPEVDDCSDIKEELDKLKKTSDLNGAEELKLPITNDAPVYSMKECSNIAREHFAGFRAALKIDFIVDTQGSTRAAYINEGESEKSHNLIMFSKCVEHFAKKLSFQNDSGKMVSFSRNFIL